MSQKEDVLTTGDSDPIDHETIVESLRKDVDKISIKKEPGVNHLNINPFKIKPGKSKHRDVIVGKSGEPSVATGEESTHSKGETRPVGKEMEGRSSRSIRIALLKVVGVARRGRLNSVCAT